MATIVQKYGGTSVEGREKLLAIAEGVAALRRDGHDVVVVVSAPGTTTDSLLSEAAAIAAEPAQRELDMLMTAGERISMSLLSIALNSIGCPAVSFTGSQVGIITDTRHTDARILEVRPHRVVDELAAGNVVVVGGFQGVSTEKDVTTLGRGGSDTTAVALAAALGADRCEIMTDVDGVYTADPNAVADALRLPEITYEDMCELARFGATVLKEDAVRLAERHGITLRVRRSGSEGDGTIVVAETTEPDRPVAGLSALEDCDLLTWEGPARGGAPVAARDLMRGARFVVALSDRTVAAVERAAFRSAPVDAADGADTVRAALIVVVGRDAGTADTAAVAADAVAAAGTSVLCMVCAGRSTVLAVEPGSAASALRALHSAFFPRTS